MVVSGCRAVIYSIYSDFRRTGLRTQGTIWSIWSIRAVLQPGEVSRSLVFDKELARWDSRRSRVELANATCD
jgi:hypothetical protein